MSDHDHFKHLEFLKQHPELVAELKLDPSRLYRAPEYSTIDLMHRLVEYYPDARYTAAWGYWSIWTGTVWEADKSQRIIDIVTKMCDLISAGCVKPHLAFTVAKGSNIFSVEKLSRAHRKYAAVIEQWDENLWLLNTPGGTVDLRNGEIYANRREDYCTKITAAAPGGDCPLWLAFLGRITAGNKDLEAFLQRMCGYSLTGEIGEHALFFLYGTGANGKSIFLNAISGAMGGYARSAPTESFMESRNDAHPTDRALLQGARLITATEVDDGRRWAESKIKQLTGGDPVNARFMRQDFFEFVPQFKLFISGNHKPGLRSVDEAMRRRFNLVPFEVTIPAAERDKTLGEKLKAEYGGILAWAIEGCLLWQKEGLSWPGAVAGATEEYLEEEDTLQRWIDERCVIDRRIALCATSWLYADYKHWCVQVGERELTEKRLAKLLEGKGFKRTRDMQTRGFIGIGLKAEAPPGPQ